MSDLEVIIDASEIRGFSAAASKAPQLVRTEMQRGMNALTATGAALAASAAPRDTGQLAASIQPQPARFAGDTVIGSYSANTEYAAQKEFGGVILPKRGRFLVFTGRDGALVFARRVVQAAQPFMRPSREKLESQIPVVFGAAMKRVMRVFG